MDEPQSRPTLSPSRSRTSVWRRIWSKLKGSSTSSAAPASPPTGPAPSPGDTPAESMTAYGRSLSRHSNPKYVPRFPSAVEDRYCFPVPPLDTSIPIVTMLVVETIVNEIRALSEKIDRLEKDRVGPDLPPHPAPESAPTGPDRATDGIDWKPKVGSLGTIEAERNWTPEQGPVKIIHWE